MFNDDIISMPDKWEYPWYAAWDLAFHTIALVAGRPRLRQGAARADAAQPLPAPERADPGLRVELQRRQPAGARLGDAVPLQARAAASGARTAPFLERSFHKLLLNFTWWVNRKDPQRAQRLRGRLPRPRQHRRLRPQRAAAHRRHLEQADGTAWMAFFCQYMLEIALILADRRPALRGRRVQVPRALHVDRRRHGPHRRAPRRDVGRGGRLLLRRPAPARRLGHAAQGALDGRPAAAVRDARSSSRTYVDRAARGSWS